MKKNIRSLLKIATVFPLLWISHSASALIVADGVVQSGGFSNPLVVDFETGSNTISFITDTTTFGPDLIQFTVEENQVLDTASLLSFIGVGNEDNKAFFGLIDATTYNPPAPGSFPGAGDLFAGMLFGTEDVGTDLFERQILDNTSEFNLPINELTAGEYIFWFNETAGLDIFSIDFQLSGQPDVGAVPLPAAVYLMLVPLATVLGFRRKSNG